MDCLFERRNMVFIRKCSYGVVLNLGVAPSDTIPGVRPEELASRIESLAPGPERDRAIELLESLRRQREENPLYFYNHPDLSDMPQHEKQMTFHSLRTKIKCFFGGNQSGKTTAGLADDLIQACDEDVLPEHLKQFKKFKPPFFCRIYAPSLAVLEFTIFEKIKELVPKSQLVGEKWDKAFDKQLQVLRFKNGSMFSFKTYLQDPFTAGGVTIHRVHYDEEPPREHRVEGRFRIARYGGDEIFTLTPLKGLSWANDELWEERGKPLDSTDSYFINEELSLGTVVVDMDDNPYLGEQEKKDALRGLSEQELDARKRGRFVHFSGLIYDDFEPDEHIIDGRQYFGDAEGSIRIPDTANVIQGIDPGLRNRAAVLFTFLTSDDTMYVYDELYEQGKTVAEVAEQIHKLNTMYQVLPIYTVIDPAARNKNHQTGRSDQMEYADHAILTIPGQNAVEAGINRVRERLQRKKLFIFNNCTNLIKEFKRYRWREAPRTGEDGKPLPMKVDDHALDCLRYIVMSRPFVKEVEEQRHETQLQRAMRIDQEREADPIAPAILR
jgi:phage terminase large subunit-like protein